jgi:hypothetical protein
LISSYHHGRTTSCNSAVSGLSHQICLFISENLTAKLSIKQKHNIIETLEIFLALKRMLFLIVFGAKT